MAERPSLAIIFAGPSLPTSSRPLGPLFDYRPPIRRGDLDMILRTPPFPPALAIVDGEFHQSLAVSPREILGVVRSGVAVYGSSSMGALRAAELHSMGMIGVGKIFEMYRDEEITSDDEVALLFDPEAQRAVSEPLVNIRCSVQAHVAAGVLDSRLAEAIIDTARSLHYTDRRYRTILRLASERIRENLTPLLDSLSAHDQKHLDALALCERVQSALRS
jgi:hypothetical protein